MSEGGWDGDGETYDRASVLVRMESLGADTLSLEPHRSGT